MSVRSAPGSDRAARAREPTIGVALSGGGAAGMAHIGALEVLAEAGVPVRVVAGTSIGALVGAAYAAGHLAGFRDAMGGLTRGRVLRLFDPTWPQSGLLSGRRSFDLVREHLGDRIEDLPLPFAAVAADLYTGERVVLRSGSVREAVRASIAIPGLFTPCRGQGRVLVDGGLVDPIPVGVAHDLGADLVIAVSVLRLPPIPDRATTNGAVGSQLLARFLARLTRGREAAHDASDVEPGLVEEGPTDRELGLINVLTRSSALIQTQIAAARLREEPADVLIKLPGLHLGLFDFHRTPEAVAAGRAAARAALPEIEAVRAALRPRPSRLATWWHRDEA